MMKRFTVLFCSMLMISCMTDNQNVINNFYMFPSPYSAGTETATFRVSLKSAVTSAKIILVIKDLDNQVVWETSQTHSGTGLDFLWSGENTNGLTVSPGIYTATLRVSGARTGEKTIELTII